MKKLLSNHRGQSLVEFALILPLLLTVLLGIAEFGRIFGGYVELQSAARDVTRYAAIHKVKTVADLAGAISTYGLLDKRLALIDPSQVTYDLSVEGNKADLTKADDIWVGVTLNHRMYLMTPFIGTIIGENYIDLESNMVMRME